ncbi:hypothetical protein J2W51_004821 [Tardiphaga robiniae]|uniref:hypothetical protein n=1 Tax=Tardiphaga robiniae TaxID=943830 RepID=UPI002865C07A|nr:hypothetical protein [Tardiphaga robiniae]MDR6662231.1 hypothetical protein [Tardiphaga robiniae]
MDLFFRQTSSVSAFDMFDWVVTIASDPIKATLTVGLSASIVTLVIGWRQGSIAQKAAEAALLSAKAANQAALASGSRAVAQARLEWLTTLRETLSEFHSILMTDEYRPNAKDRLKLCELGTKLDLLLNQGDPDQRALWELTDQVYNTLDNKKLEELDAPLVAAARKVFKSEWDRVKAEMLGKTVTG